MLHIIMIGLAQPLVTTPSHYRLSPNIAMTWMETQGSECNIVYLNILAGQPAQTDYQHIPGYQGNKSKMGLTTQTS